MSDPFSKPIKLQFFTETKRLPQAPRTFEELQSILNDTYNIPNPVVQYKDEDDDLITVSSQPEYEDALMLGGDRIVKLNVLTMNSLRCKPSSAFDNFDSICTVPMTVSRMSGAVPSLRESFIPELFRQERSEADSDFQSLLKHSKLVDSDSESEDYEIEDPIKETDEHLEESKEADEYLHKSTETLPITNVEAGAGMTYSSSFVQTENISFAQENQTDDYNVYTAITDCVTSQLARFLHGAPYPFYPHPDKRCNDCHDFPIYGACFVCSDCPGLSICENCMVKSSHDHIFIKVKPPAYVRELEVRHGVAKVQCS